MSDSVWPPRRQPTRLPRPWDSLGKNTGVGCHFLLQCRKVKSESEVAQSCLTPSDPMDCSLPGSSIYGSCQARVLEWGAIAFSDPTPLGWNTGLQRCKPGQRSHMGMRQKLTTEAPCTVYREEQLHYYTCRVNGSATETICWCGIRWTERIL